MSRRLSLRPEAMAEIREAAAWYGERGLELDVAELVIVACFHSRRDPEVWRRRL